MKYVIIIILTATVTSAIWIIAFLPDLIKVITYDDLDVTLKEIIEND